MSAQDYFTRIAEVLSRIQSTQKEKIQKAAAVLAHSISSGGRAYLFGSGHSVLPVLDIFPRYGSFVGFYPIYDPRLMWFNVVGPGGARELLWLERQEGYARVILASYVLEPRDSFVVFSHGGLNAVPIEIAMDAKQKGLTVVSVSSLENYRKARATHVCSARGRAGENGWGAGAIRSRFHRGGGVHRHGFGCRGGLDSCQKWDAASDFRIAQRRLVPGTQRTRVSRVRKSSCESYTLTLDERERAYGATVKN